MVKRMLCLLSAFLILSSMSLAAEEIVKPRVKPALQAKPIKMFTGTFVNPAGRAHKIRVADGGHINIKNVQEGLFYRLSARTGQDGLAEVTIEQYLDAEYSTLVAEERLDVSLDGRTKRSSVAPFRFTLDGERMARAELRSGAKPDKAIGGACCIDCGDGWEICCGVMIYEEGWLACCWIDTWCAWCEVCAWWLE